MAFTGSVFVKELLQVPVISIGVLPLIESSKDLAPNGLGMEPASSRAGKMKQDLLRWLVKNIFIRKPNKQFQRIMEEHGIEHNNVFLFDLLSHKANFILQSGTPGFEYYRSDLSNNVKFIGPLLPFSVRQEDNFWFDKRLTQYKKIVLVTQGTVEKDPAKLIVPTLEAFKNSDTLVICTTGGSQTAVLKKQYQYANIIIEDFIAFADVMPYAHVYVTNGGYGGVMLSIENQLPMVTAGVHEGKNEICARVGYFKLGINLKTEQPSPEQIIMAVNEVMTNDVYKNNIENLGKEFKQYNANELCLQYVQAVTPPKVIARRKSFQLA